MLALIPLVVKLVRIVSHLTNELLIVKTSGNSSFIKAI